MTAMIPGMRSRRVAARRYLKIAWMAQRLEYTEKVALVAEEEAEHLGDGEYHLAVGNIQH
jgi:hypothetical protein